MTLTRMAQLFASTAEFRDAYDRLDDTAFVTAIYRNQEWRLTSPRVIHGHPDRQPLPWLVRRALSVIGVRDFLDITATPSMED